jgi:hypothetical protein
LSSAENLYVNNNQAYTKLKNGDYTNGLSLLAGVILSTVGNDKADAIYNRGLATYLQGDEITALEDLLLAISLKPENNYLVYGNPEADFIANLSPTIHTIFQFDNLKKYDPTGGETLSNKISCTSFSQINIYGN